MSNKPPPPAPALAPMPRPCECRFCKPSHALDRIAERLAGDATAMADVAEVGAALDAWYEETFELQFDLDCIASAVGIENAMGANGRQIIDRIIDQNADIDDLRRQLAEAKAFIRRGLNR